MCETMAPEGVVRLICNGVLFEEFNLITEDGRLWIAERCAGVSQPITHMAVGIGTTVASDVQTSLVSEIHRQALSGAPSCSLVLDTVLHSTRKSGSVKYSATFAEGVATGAWTEAALCTAASGGRMPSRLTFPVKNKAADDTFIIEWEYRFGPRD